MFSLEAGSPPALSERTGELDHSAHAFVLQHRPGAEHERGELGHLLLLRRTKRRLLRRLRAALSVGRQRAAYSASHTVSSCCFKKFEGVMLYPWTLALGMRQRVLPHRHRSTAQQPRG